MPVENRSVGITISLVLIQFLLLVLLLTLCWFVGASTVPVIFVLLNIKLDYKKAIKLKRK